MEKNRPVWDVKLGAISCAIFESRHGEKKFMNATITRRFKQGTEWMSSTSFTGIADLTLVRQAVDLAIEWLSKNECTSSTSEE